MPSSQKILHSRLLLVLNMSSLMGCSAVTETVSGARTSGGIQKNNSPPASPISDPEAEALDPIKLAKKQDGAVIDASNAVPRAQGQLGCLASYRANAPASQSAYPSEFKSTHNSPWTYVAWVWREPSGVEKNHSVSVARTQDMVNWYNTCGEKLTLPIGVESKTVVDAIQHNGGLLNNIKLGSDPEGNPIISYMKYVKTPRDSGAPVVTTQIFNARFKNNKWTIHQMTNWTTQYLLSGGGSLPPSPNSVSFSAVQATSDGRMFQTFSRGSLDSKGLPASGAYLLNMESLVLEGNYRFDDPNPLRKKPPAAPTDARVPETRPAAFSTPFERKLVMLDYDHEWFAFQGNFKSLNSPSVGIFQQSQGKFLISHEDGTKDEFRLGPATDLLLPVIGAWGSGEPALDGVGVFRPRDNRAWITNVLASGNPFFTQAYSSFNDFINDFNYGVKDGPFTTPNYSTIIPTAFYDPAQTSFLAYDALPSYRDQPYNCSGQPLSSQTGQWKTCPQKFLSNLYLYEFNASANTWSKTYIDKAWGGVKVSFSLAKYRDLTAIVYYNSDRMVEIAFRKAAGAWQYKTLDSQFDGFDSHNYLTLIIDERQSIHVSGNLHNNSLNYWRTTTSDLIKGPLLNSLTRFAMVGTSETRTTYPRFFRGPKGDLLFTYRFGVSGNGMWITNKYNPNTKKWTRLSAQPLFGG